MATHSRLVHIMGLPTEALVLRMSASRKVVSKKNMSNGEDIYGNERVWKLDNFYVAVTESNVKKDVDIEHINAEKLYK